MTEERLKKIEETFNAFQKNFETVTLRLIAEMNSISDSMSRISEAMEVSDKIRIQNVENKQVLTQLTSALKSVQGKLEKMSKGGFVIPEAKELPVGAAPGANMLDKMLFSESAPAKEPVVDDLEAEFGPLDDKLIPDQYKKVTPHSPPPQTPAPQVPAQPAIPQVPAQPSIPKMPAQPAIPQVPAEPSIPKMPAQPAIPQVPAQPSIPKMPAQPAIPQVPAQPAMAQPTGSVSSSSIGEKASIEPSGIHLPGFKDIKKTEEFAFSALPPKPGAEQTSKSAGSSIHQDVIENPKKIKITDWKMVSPATTIQDLLKNMMVAAECSTNVSEIGQHIIDTKEMIGKINMFHPILFEMLIYGGQLKTKKTEPNNEAVLRDLLSKVEKWLSS